MERLTKRTADGITAKEDYGEKVLKTLYSCYGGKPNPHYTNCEEGYCAIEKLAEYEDAEEQGLLLRLPCKVGDKVWYINKPFILEYEVTGFSVDETGAWLMQIEHYAGETDRTYGYNLETDSLGTTWFLSKEEAEAKLKEMEESHG